MDIQDQDQDQDSTIVLVCIDRFQPYIITNIDFLIRLQHHHIVVLTNRHLFSFFENCDPNRRDATPTEIFSQFVHLVAIEDLSDPFEYLKRSQMDSVFLLNTSMRFFYLYAYMKKYNVSNVFHIENDVILFYNVSVLYPFLLHSRFKDKMLIPFDSYERNIGSIVFVPHFDVLGKILALYRPECNDMQNFVSLYKQLPQCIDSFPIFVLGVESGNEEIDFVCRNFHYFGGFIFDAAAIGQYLGGVDPKNIPGNTAGFVNETCVVKYNHYRFQWKNIDHVYRPILILSGRSHVIQYGELEIPIFNLHVHSKDLNKFIL